MRFKYHYGTFTRAFSKSFLSVLALYLRCIFLPNSKVFLCTAVKAQAIKIATQKLQEIWNIWPLLERELMTGGKHMQQDFVSLTFKNGSLFDVVTMSNAARGARATAGLVEESATIDGDDFNEIIVPLMTVSRRLPDGTVDPNEPHMATNFVTTASDKSCYGFEKLVELAVMSIIKPELSFCWGGSYEIPVRHGLFDKASMEEIRLSSTFKEESFNKEYRSIWTGSNADAWFNIDKISRYRRLLKYETRASILRDKEAFYLISVDVARVGVNTAIHVWKAYPSGERFHANLVNTFVINGQHFAEQATFIKKLDRAFNPREIVVDGTGVGLGLVDFLVVDTRDEKTGEDYSPLYVSNDEDYLNKQPKNCEKKVYVLKANSTLNNEVHNNFYLWLNGGQISFLANERVAKAKLMKTKMGQKMSPSDRAVFTMPFEMTSRLFDEIGNLRLKSGNRLTEVEQITQRIPKDRYSAASYGIWRIKYYESEWIKKKRKRSNGFSKFIFMS